MNYLLRRRKLGRTSVREIVAHSRTGLRGFRNDSSLPEAELVFRWGCTSTVPSGAIVNTAEAIHKTSNKLAFRMLLDDHDLCPTTWHRVEDVQYPAIVRPAFHHQGRHLWLCRNEGEVREALRHPRVLNYGWYASELIDKVAEYRVFVVQGRIVCVARKHPANPNAIAWNVAQGGRFENVNWDQWPLRAVRVSIEAMKLSGLDFGGVDVMVDREGECYVLEINAAPSLTSEYRQSCMAKAFDWIVTHGKDQIPLIKERGGWKKFIHPALSRETILV